MAGGRIKGITIEFDGNTTKLQKSLSGLDKSLKTSQNNLKDINKLLKLDPKNTELLTQKQKNLKKAIGETKERLDKLKGAQSQVKEGTDEWDSLQREIIATEQDLKGLEEEHKEFGSVANQKINAVGDSIKELGSKISEVGDKISGFGTNVTTHVTAPIAAVGGASIAAFKSVDTGMDTIIKKTGATGETAEEMRGILERLATSIPTDFETAGAAIGEVNTRFGVTGDELEELSAKFIKFADLNDTDVSSSIDSVQAAMAAFNLDSSEAGNVLDMLNKAGQDTGVSLDTLTGQLLTNSASFDELGMDINQSIGFLSQLEKNGLDTSTVLGGMKKALQNATKEGKPMNEALAELQEKMQNVTRFR